MPTDNHCHVLVVYCISDLPVKNVLLHYINPFQRCIDFKDVFGPHDWALDLAWEWYFGANSWRHSPVRRLYRSSQVTRKSPTQIWMIFGCCCRLFPSKVSVDWSVWSPFCCYKLAKLIKNKGSSGFRIDTFETMIPGLSSCKQRQTKDNDDEKYQITGTFPFQTCFFSSWMTELYVVRCYR